MRLPSCVAQKVVWVKGLWFRIYGLGCLGFRVQGLGFRVQGLGLRARSEIALIVWPGARVLHVGLGCVRRV